MTTQSNIDAWTFKGAKAQARSADALERIAYALEQISYGIANVTDELVKQGAPQASITVGDYLETLEDYENAPVDTMIAALGAPDDDISPCWVKFSNGWGDPDDPGDPWRRPSVELAGEGKRKVVGLP